MDPLRQVIDWNDIIQSWPAALNFLRPVLAKLPAPDDERSCFNGLMSGHYNLWLAENGAGITQVVKYSMGSQCNLLYISMLGEVDEVAALRQLERWAAASGCNAFIIAGCRPGFIRSPGWKEALASYTRQDAYYKPLGVSV